MPVARSPVTYAPVMYGVLPRGVYPLSNRYSIAMRSDQLSPIAPPCDEVMPPSGPAIMRLLIAWVYSWPMTVMSKSPSTQGG
nr:hypothetical protein GCM10020092_050730 [Actinoplanes digitatis]